TDMSQRWRASSGGLLGIAIVSLLALGASGPASGPGPILGFRSSNVEAERAREAKISGMISPDSLRKYARVLTEEPHVAGTPADRATAEYVLQKFQACGIDAHIEEYPIWLNYPKKVTLELVEPAPATPLATREKGLSMDKDSYAREAFDGFNGYAPSGEVDGQ